MKVKELIERLSEMAPDAEITVQHYAGCHGLDDTHQIYDTDFFEASERYNTPSTAYICVDNGCFCDSNRGTKTKKFELGPQNISQYWLGIDAVEKAIYKTLEWYTKELEKIGKAKDYEESIAVGKYQQTKRALENIIGEMAKLKYNGQKTT